MNYANVEQNYKIIYGMFIYNLFYYYSIIVVDRFYT